MQARLSEGGEVASPNGASGLRVGWEGRMPLHRSSTPRALPPRAPRRLAPRPRSIQIGIQIWIQIEIPNLRVKFRSKI